MNTLTFKAVYQITINLLERCQDPHLPKVNLKNYYKNFDNEKFEEDLKNHLSSVQDFESFHVAFKTTLDRFVRLNKNLCETTINAS